MRKLKFLIIFLMFVFGFFGCANADEKVDYEGPGGSDAEETKLEESAPERKIIYTVNTSIKTDDLEKTISSIKANLENDEWFDEESISLSNASFVIRIKSSRIDDFINSLKEVGTISNYTKKSTDISLKYEDNTYEIAALEAELARLNVLYENASMNEMIELNKRISTITKDVNKLKGVLREFDSLVDYSEIYLYINETKYIQEEDNFIGKIGNAFTGGWNAVLSLLKGIVIVISAILPFMVIIIPVGGTIFIGYKIQLKKRNKQQQ